VVDAEEVPEISKMNVSDRESFIGVFYRDGNFKVMHKGKDIFNLSDAAKDAPGDNRITDRLSNIAKARRYSGTGFALAGDTPLFYRANSFASYLFPHEYFASFHALGINPKQIETVMYPSENFLRLGRFLKWKHARGAKLSLFCDSSEIPMLKSLFEKAKIQDAPFSGMKHEISIGFSVSAVGKTTSVRIETEHPSSGKKIRLAFIKGPSDIRSVMKEKFDLVITTCRAYGESSAHFRSAGAPVAVIDDGSTSSSRIPLLDTTLLRNDMQYDIEPLADDGAFLEKISSYLPEDELYEVLKKDPASVEAICKAGVSARLSGDGAVQYFNTMSLLKFLFNSTSDRKLSAALKNNLPAALSSASRSEVYKMPFTHRIDLLLLNGIIYEFASKLQEASPADAFLLDDIHSARAITKKLDDPSERAFYKKITEDRIRLEKLLALFSGNAAFRADVQELKEALGRRKELFRQEILMHPNQEKGFIGKLRESSDIESAAAAVSPEQTERFPYGISSNGRIINSEDKNTGHTGVSAKKSSSARRNIPASIASAGKKIRGLVKPLKIPFIVVLALAVCLLIAYGAMKIHSSYKTEQIRKAEKIEVERKAAEKKRIIQTYSVNVTEYDIYQYANETALKNGYAPLIEKNLKKRNPHWIYPGNVFVLPDDTRITVKDRDTLWDIARERLEQKYVDFFRLYEVLKKEVSAGKKPDRKKLDEAYGHASKDEHRKLLKNLESNGTK
jgi:hypothetical protein